MVYLSEESNACVMDRGNKFVLLICRLCVCEAEEQQHVRIEVFGVIAKIHFSPLKFLLRLCTAQFVFFAFLPSSFPIFEKIFEINFQSMAWM